MVEFVIAILAATTLLLVVLGFAEAIAHRRNLSAIPVRVHVNGTRGKSSVTRLIAAGLRAGGMRTCAKTTGTLPRLLHPDGAEEPIYRVGRPNVIEQVDVVRRARSFGAQALVMECMALEPFLQWISAKQLVRPTHGLITNVRADHLEVMGPTPEHVAYALAGSIPYGSRLYTAEMTYGELLRHASLHRKSEMVSVSRDEIEAVPEEELKRFRYIEHPDNVALALKVCEDLGVPREVALAGMRRSKPDPGALTVDEARVCGTCITFVNGFAANDPESTEKVWELALRRADPTARRIALFNCRIDRPERSQQLGRAAVEWTPADGYVVVGSGTNFFTSMALKAGIDPKRLYAVEGETANSVARRLAEIGGDGAVVVGLGNIGGVGLALLDILRAQEEALA